MRVMYAPARVALALLVASLGAAACGDDAATVPGSTSVLVPTTVAATTSGPATTSGGSGPIAVDGEGTSAIPSDSLQGALAGITPGTITTTERDALVFMREEERLALDVYTALSARWQLPVFANIAKAEATHTASVKTLLDRYGIADPTAGRAAGTYQDPRIQALYTALVAKGSTSEVAALQVGAEIEELDIKDLRDRATTTPDIALVFDNLEKGSRNHLRSFTSQLATRGATYVPVHLAKAAYDAIVSSGIERGRAG